MLFDDLIYDPFPSLRRTFTRKYTGFLKTIRGFLNSSFRHVKVLSHFAAEIEVFETERQFCIKQVEEMPFDTKTYATANRLFIEIRESHTFSLP